MMVSKKKISKPKSNEKKVIKIYKVKKNTGIDNEINNIKPPTKRLIRCVKKND